MNRTDDELMADFQNGDESAFNVLASRYYETMQGWLLRWTGGDWHRAQDLVQGVFLRLIQKKHLYRGDGKFRGFLFTLARRHALGVLAKNRVRAVEYDDSLSREPNPADVVETREMIELQRREMAELEEIDRDALSGLMSQETIGSIASRYGVPAGTVKSRINRAKRQIRDGLARFADVA